MCRDSMLSDDTRAGSFPRPTPGPRRFIREQPFIPTKRYETLVNM